MTSAMELPRSAYTVDVDNYKLEVVTCLVKAHECAREQIKKAQVRQKVLICIQKNPLGKQDDVNAYW